MNNFDINCEFSNPVYWDEKTGETSPLTAEPKMKDKLWNFETIICGGSGQGLDDGVLELIENENTGANFYLEKSFNYGDFFLMFFVAVATCVFIVKGIWVFFNKN